MRLLNVHSLELETFDHRNAPPYAILSHTWGDDEVSYQTLTSKPEVKSGSGWAKILGTCKQAIQDKYDWVWIDTCNIDKSSSAELSEAINSMFVWYQRAGVCYALFEDVHVEDDGGLDWIRSVPHLLGAARWFTRGWTLQELIAPRNVVFYSASWKPLGTKRELCSVLADITGVHERVLQNAAMLSTTSIAQRMSWAASRQTTRVEDIAYCLLGIFGVTMPLLYGEGSRAFVRLQEELTNRFNDQTIFAWCLPALAVPDTSERDDSAWESLFGGGVLALHPLAFQNSSHIVQETRLDTASQPTSITTRGIHLEVYLMPTDDPTVFAWLLPCSSTEQKGRMVIILLRTPSSRTKRYSRIIEGIESIRLTNEAHITDLSYKQIYLKKAVEHNPHPISRICILRSFPSHLLEPIEGLVVDLNKPSGGPLITKYDGVMQNARPWDPDGWTVDLGTSSLYNGIALTFSFKPSFDQSKYVVVVMAFPGPTLMAIVRYTAADEKPPLDFFLTTLLKDETGPHHCNFIAETGKSIAIKVDVEVEHGGIVYAFDVHFEPTQGGDDRLVVWKEEGREDKVFADYSVMLNAPKEIDPEFQRLIDEGVIFVD